MGWMAIFFYLIECIALKENRVGEVEDMSRTLIQLPWRVM